MIGLLLTIGILISMAVFEKIKKKQVNFGFVVLSFILIVFALIAFTPSPSSAPLAAVDAYIKIKLDNIKTMAAIHYNSFNSYVGFDQNNEYVDTQRKLEDIYKGRGLKNYYSIQTKEKEYCVRAKLLSKDIYWCVDSKGNGGEVTDQHCTAEKPYCAE
jgi:hypothetical protein